jgi:RNA polymerase sigma-70 factor (ECF subfamily)
MTSIALELPRRVATVARVSAAAESQATPMDPESREWIAGLRARDADAIARLHDLLLRASRFEVGRRRSAFPHLRGDVEDLTQEAADDALVAILARLDDFRGLSRFTTWAYKFALYEAGAKLRRRAWQGREIPLDEPAWETFHATGGPSVAAERTELLAAVRDSLEVLSEHQRRVFTALALNDVPIDVLAERLDTTRGALYKALHDARTRLRGELERRGFDLEGSAA